MVLRTSKILIGIFILLSLTLIISLASGFYYRFWFQGLDSSGFLELINRSFKEKSLNSNAFASAVDYVRLIWNPAYDCANIIDYQLEANITPIHAYTISYLVSFVGHILPMSNLTLISILFGFNFAIPIIFGLFGFLKIKKIVLVRQKLLYGFMLLLVVFTLTIWPPFMVGMQGQLYFDRLSISLFFILGYLLPKLNVISRNMKIVFIFCLFLSPLISERSTLISILICVFALYKLFHHRVNNKIYLIILSFHLVLYTTYYFMWKTYFADPSLNIIPDIPTIISRLQYLTLNFTSSGLLTFVYTLIPMLLLNLFSRINFVLALIVALPNLIFNVGGAELTGFSTHYHSLYVGFMLAGLFNSFHKLFANQNKSYSKIAFGFLIIISLCSSLYYYNSLGSLKRNIESSLGIESLRTRSEIEITLSQRDLILNEFDKNASYSIAEGLFPGFVEKESANLSIFPLNLGEAEYAIIDIDSTNGLPYLYPWVFPDPIKRYETQLCLQNRLETEYNFLNNFNNYHVYQKIN
jgi:hypothetical protein